MAKIGWVEVEGERVALSKNRLLGWKVIQPIKNEDGTTNWFNFLVGGWPGLTTLLIYALIIFVVYHGILGYTEQCKAVMADPCSYCKVITSWITK